MRRVTIEVAGIVQGVGFRPFVYRLATGLELTGLVFNGGKGVTIEIEGESAKLEQFLTTLKQTPPVLARIDSIKSNEVACEQSQDFIIKASDQGQVTTLMASDTALCDACTAEMHDPKNRRFAYPFINCTNCGPRYTLIKALPYDRAQSSMAPFSLCKACQAEYSDPNDRRYHAQAICCDRCGPSLYALDLEGKVTAEKSEALDVIVGLIKEGKTVALKGVGGFHLVCDATNEEAVKKLRRNKRRASKPLAVMFGSIEALQKEALVSADELALIVSKERPIVVVSKAHEGRLASNVAPEIDKIGVFLPYTPLHILLLERLDVPIVATSANLSQEPIITDEKVVVSRLPHMVSAVLSHDREIVNACDDSVAMMAGEHRLLLRMARGLAPKSLPLKTPTSQSIVALGGHQKSSFALAFENSMIVSPHIADLGTIEAFDAFEHTLHSFLHRYSLKPSIIVCDKHPDYETTKWARKEVAQNSSIKYIEVQHHYAHVLACMAEYALDEKVLAFCFDGSGYGDDATLWGGEVLIADPLKYDRVLHLAPLRLIGGEKAVKEPRRVALSLLFECFSLDEVLAMDLSCVKSFTQEEITTLHTMWHKGINAPLTSSIGRLFDAVASLAGITQILDYEGESGLLLESYASQCESQKRFSLPYEKGKIAFEPMVKELLSMTNPQEIAFIFIASITDLIVSIAKEHGSLPVVLSGGVFQNRLLVSQATKLLKKAGLRYYVQRDTPVNDGGIALGQLYHALHVSRNKDV